jgi:hypothetical protein
MISDFQILGIEETEDKALIKSAFRRRAKELHPDAAAPGELLERHDLFVEVCKAYRRLMGSPGERAQPERSRSRPAGATELSLHADQAYAFYRAGMRHFMKIHPSQWNIDTSRKLNTRIAGKDEDQAIIRDRILELVKLFPKAYYYFSIVVHEYPGSGWASDAAEKMQQIEKRIGMYRHIIESFSTWNVDKKAAIARFRESLARSDKTRKAVRKDPPEGWGG